MAAAPVEVSVVEAGTEGGGVWRMVRDGLCPRVKLSTVRAALLVLVCEGSWNRSRSGSMLSLCLESGLLS